MRSITRRLAVALFALVALCAGAGAQINPKTDVRWPTCSSGQAYAPTTNTCIPVGSGSGFPSGASQFGVNDNTNSPAVTPNLTYDQVNQKVVLGAASSVPKGPLVMCSFGGATGSTPLSGDIDALFVSVSTDGKNWQLISTGYTGISGSGVRDPSCTKIGQTYYVAFTEGGGSSPYTGFGLASSNDLHNWTSIGTVDITGTNPMSAYTWAPEWFIENPGCTGATGTDNDGYTCAGAQVAHIFYADSLSGEEEHNIYEIKASALPLTATSWSNNAGTANAADLVYNAVANGASAIDPFVVRTGSSTWDMFYVNDQGGAVTCTTTGVTACNIQYGSASSLAGSYTPVTSGDWTGEIGTTFHDAEAPAIYSAGTDSSGNTVWRLSFDNYFTIGTVGPGLVYLEAHATAGTAFNAMTWTAAGVSGNNYQTLLQPPTGIASSGADSSAGNFHHGTIRRFLDLDTARDISDALISQTATWHSTAGGSVKGDVYLNTATNTTTAGWQKIPVDTVAYDTASIWNAANKRFIPNAAGYYLISGRVRTGTGGSINAAVGLNGVQYIGLGADPGATSLLAAGGSALVYCNGTTDYIELWSYVTSARALTTGSFDTWLQILGPF